MNSETASNPQTYSGVKVCALALFWVGFAVAYFFFMGSNVAAFTYFPKTMEFGLGTVKMTGESGPGMTWYGWMVYAALSGLLCSSLALIPAIRKRLSDSQWVLGAVVVVLIVLLVIAWFYKKYFI